MSDSYVTREEVFTGDGGPQPHWVERVMTFDADGNPSATERSGVGPDANPTIIEPPAPIDIAALRTTVSKATTVTQLRGAMMAYLDAVPE